MPLIVLLGNGAFLSACHHKEKNLEQEQNQSITSQNLSSSTTSQPNFHTTHNTIPTSSRYPNNKIASAIDDIDEKKPLIIDDDTLSMDGMHPADSTHLDTMLEHYAINQFMPNGEESEDFQQAYLASIYTMHHNKANIQKDDTPDAIFVKNMILHRQGAMDLAKLQLKYGRDDRLKYFAKDIIATQENEIWLMEHWLKETYPTLPKNQNNQNHTTQETLQQEYANSFNQMHEQMLIGALQDDADTVFIQTMLPYHKGALVLAQAELKYGSDSKVRSFADNIIMNQIPEIQVMQQWKKQHR